MTRHNLKVHLQFWEPLISGLKPFDLRRNDRNYRIGDELCLCEYNPNHGMTGQQLVVKISYILLPEDCPGLQAGFCIMGLCYDIS